MPRNMDKRREKAKEDKRLEKAEAYRDRFEHRQATKQEARTARAEVLGKALPGVKPPPVPSHKRLLPPVPNAPIRSKHDALALPSTDGGFHDDLTRGAKRDETSYRISGEGLVLSQEGTKGHFDEPYPNGRLFWRADDRPPKQVLRTGFTTKIERDAGKPKADGNRIVYRTGDDDVVPATGVSIARDIRGSAFFPFEAHDKPNERRQEHAFLYAVKVGHAASTFRAQKTADQAESGSTQWRDPARHGYDPTEQRSDTATSVWPFNEHAAHRVEPHQIVGAYRLKRERLVKPEATGDDIKAGMRFSIGQKNLIPGRARDPRAVEAQHYVKQFADTYPKHPSHFLSYQGIVEKRGKGKIDTAGEAETHARQLNPFPPGPTPFRPAKQARRDKAKQSRNFSSLTPPGSGGNSRTKGQRFR
jgi:hypothetical protein